MKAVHISIAALAGALAMLVTGIVTKDTDTIGTAVLAIIGAFLPCVQLAFPQQFKQPAMQGEMPTLVEVPKP